jgi:hypothetical protein
MNLLTVLASSCEQMFHRASLKLGLERAVLLGVTRDGHEDSDDDTNASGRPSQVELDRMLRVGAYDIFEEGGGIDGEAGEAGGQASDIDIDALLVRSTADAPTELTPKGAAGNGGGINNSFSRASFVCSRVNKAAEGAGVDMMDPEFWTKVVGLKENVQVQDLAEREGGRRGRRGRDNVSYQERREGDIYNDMEDGEGDEAYDGGDKGKASAKGKSQKQAGPLSLNKKQEAGLIKALASMGAPTIDYGVDEDGARADGARADGLLHFVVQPLSWSRLAARAGIALLPRKQEQTAEQEAQEKDKPAAEKAATTAGAQRGRSALLPLALVKEAGAMLLEQAIGLASKNKGGPAVKVKGETGAEGAAGGSGKADDDAAGGAQSGTKDVKDAKSSVLKTTLGPVQAKSIREMVELMKQLHALEGVLVSPGAGSAGVNKEKQGEEDDCATKRRALFAEVRHASQSIRSQSIRCVVRIKQSGKCAKKSAAAAGEMPGWWKTMGAGVGDTALLLGVAKHGVGQGWAEIEADGALPFGSALATAQAEALVQVESAAQAEGAVKEALTAALFPSSKQCQKRLDLLLQALAPHSLQHLSRAEKPIKAKLKSKPKPPSRDMETAEFSDRVSHFRNKPSAKPATSPSAKSPSAKSPSRAKGAQLPGELINRLLAQKAAISIQQDNPKRGKSREVYEGYKGAGTIDQVLQMGGTKGDLKNDLQKGLILCTDEGLAEEVCKLSAQCKTAKQGNAFSMLMPKSKKGAKNEPARTEPAPAAPSPADPVPTEIAAESASGGNLADVKQVDASVTTKPMAVLQPVVGSKRANNSVNTIQSRSPKAAKTSPAPAASSSSSSPAASSAASSHPLDSLMSVGQSKAAGKTAANEVKSTNDTAAPQVQGVKRKELQGSKTAQQKPKQKPKQQKPKSKKKQEKKGNIGSFFTKAEAR